jgi:hypothetical protein
MKLIDHALAYAQAGWMVFPLASRQKIPLAGSSGFKDATTDSDRIQRWWSERPDANIGLATGKPSGVWVIDVDQKNGKDGAASLKAFAAPYTDVPQRTKRVRTPTGGTHLYVKYDAADPIRSRADVLTGIDIRGDGGYVVLPPSTIDLGEYVWAPDAAAIEVAPATSWFAALPKHTGELRVHQGHGDAVKRDRSRRLRWDMALAISRQSDLTIEKTAVGQKYTCRCPFHDDGKKSAFFLRKSETYGFLFCSACDTSWATEAKTTPLHSQIVAIEARLAQIQEMRNGN